MLKGLFDRFRKKDDFPETTEIQLSKIDKHMNFILRDNLGYINKSIMSKIGEINQKKEEIIVALRGLHKSHLQNTHIPNREINIMDGNRENYIKKISHFVSNVDVPKNYLDTYDYCIKFSGEMAQLNSEIQKNIFVLHHFFANEVKDINRLLHNLEDDVISIRTLLEKNGIVLLKDIQKDIKDFTNNLVKINDLKQHIIEENSEIRIHKEKLDRLNKRIETITTGTDYRALEGFKKEKEDAETEIQSLLKEVEEQFSCLDTALKKYYYLNPDKKISKEYMDDVRGALTRDHGLEIATILSSLKELISNNQVELKDNKKERCMQAIERLTLDHLKSVQSQILKLEDAKQRAQTKITHNSASLNMSEQEYWINATEDKAKYHQANIDKIEKNIGIIRIENEEIIEKIRIDLQKLLDKEIRIVDDITDSITTATPQNPVKDAK